MNNIFFTSDTHFFHKNIIKYCNRPFDSVEDMNESLISNWNSKVGVYDTVFHLGDFCMGANHKSIIDRLNGLIYLIKGNHDFKYKNIFNLFCGVYDNKIFRIDGHELVMSHFCYRVWYNSHFNSWHLYGHSHGKLPPIGKSLDVGVDSNDYAPVSFDELKVIMDGRPDNCNYLGNKN